MVKRILVGLGGTPYTQSEIQHALELARAHEAEVTAVTVIDLARVSDVGPIPLGASAAAASLVDYRLQVTQKAIDEAVAQFKTAASQAGVRHRVISEAGNPFEELVNLWRYHDVTVLALQSLFAYGVVRDPRDMLVQLIAKGVRPILAVARPHRAIQRVLIAYSGSMESAKAMKQFIEMRLWPQVQLEIVCFEKPADEARQLMIDAADYCRAHGFAPQTAAPPGPAEGLLDYAAARNVDMIVAGSSARARIFKHLLGDVVLKLVRQAEIPLFITQ